MLAIGAVIGAGIFGAIGTAAAGQLGPNGDVIRYGAGPALVFSFLLLGAACALAALCYAELAAMIPQAGSAYAYSYATLGELVAWIIGWDLILEYAVGNVAVAISWGDYFTTLMRGVGVQFPLFLTTGYRTALLSSDPAMRGLLDTAPRIAGMPILVNVPAFGIVMLITWLLLRGARESSTANNIMVVIKLLALGLFIAVGLRNIHPENYHPFAPNGFRGIHQGAAIVFFAYIGFDAISTAAEETRDPQRNLPLGILGGLAICTVIYVIVGAVLTGMVPYQQLAVADPLARALQLAGYAGVGWIVALGAAISMSAVLLVFQYGQPRIFFSMARDGLLPQWAARVSQRTRVPYATTLLTGIVVALASLVGDAAETYDLTNIGTLFAFMLVSIGVLILRYVEPERPRPFKVPLAWPTCTLSAAACLFIMYGLPQAAWLRFCIWLVGGLALYFGYGMRNSRLRASGAMPLDARRSVSHLLFSFHGRIPREGYWVGTVLISIAYSLVALVGQVWWLSLARAGTSIWSNVETGSALILLAELAVFSVWTSLALQVKRWHDRGRSGWLVLLMLVPIVGIVWTFIELGCLPGSPGENSYGLNPI
jgi:APA family basic amino acid/polyamine antiporter